MDSPSKFAMVEPIWAVAPNDDWTAPSPEKPRSVTARPRSGWSGPAFGRAGA